MVKKKTKVYIYTRVSTAIQIDGYSLDAQKTRMKAFCDYNDYEIVGEYEDAGKSGKSTEGRYSFKKMIDDIKLGKDDISYVLVFKLSRFGRNAADVLATLQVMQDYGVNLICVEDGIDSSKDAGKLMISVLSAVAEIERENIRVQTMEGRAQKAREGKWNGGFAPYGYKLVDGNLEINEKEAIAIRTIFDLYINTTMGSTSIAKYLDNHGIVKLPRQNGKCSLFNASLINRIIENPVYCGKIAFGRRTTEKIKGTRNDYHLVKKDDYILVDGIHDSIVSKEVWNKAQEKRNTNSKKYKRGNKAVKLERSHMLSGLVACPECGAGMYANKSSQVIKGTKYTYYYYACKHRDRTRGYKCTYRKQIRENMLDNAVLEVISNLVSRREFASEMNKLIKSKVDVSEIDQEIAKYEKRLNHFINMKNDILSDMNSLDVEDKHFQRKKEDLEKRLYDIYDSIEEVETLLDELLAKRHSVVEQKVSVDNVYKTLIYFDKLVDEMDEKERRTLVEQLINKIEIYPEKQSNGQWLKSIEFKLPIIEKDMELFLDKKSHVETVARLSR